MSFSKNEYFENSVLEVRLIYDPNDDQEVNEIKGTKINWYEDRDPTVREVKKKQKNKKTGVTRFKFEKVDNPSIFNIFKDRN